MKTYKKLLVALFILYTVSGNKDAFASNFLWDLKVGENEYRQNNFQFAKDYFISYLNNNPNDKDAYWWLAKTYKSLNDSRYLANFKKAYELENKEKNLDKITFNVKNTANIEDYFDMATMYFESGNIKEAEFYADMMLKINPKSSSAYYIKAGALNIKGEVEKAREYMEKAIIFNNELLSTNLAQSLGIETIPQSDKQTDNLNALESYYEGDLSQAIAYLQKANEKDPNDPEIASKLVNLMLQDNIKENALKILDTAIKVNENNVTLLLAKANYFDFENNKSAKHNTLLKAYKINPNNQNVLNELGNYYLENKDWESARKYFEILTNVNDAYFEGIFGYAICLLELGRFDEVSAQVRKLNKLNPNASEISYLLSKICYYQGNFTEALDYIEEALREDENPNYYLEEAKLNYILKNYKVSLESLNDAFNMPYSANNVNEINHYYIKNYIKLKNYSMANEFLAELNEQDKNGILYKYYLFNISVLKDEQDRANSLLVDIKRYKPSTVEEFIDLSDIFYDLRGLDAAMKIVDTGLRKYIDNKRLYFQKIKLYALEGESAKKSETIKKLKSIE